MARPLLITFLLLFVQTYLLSQVQSISETAGSNSIASLTGAKYSWTNEDNVKLPDNLYSTSTVSANKRTNLLISTNWGFISGIGANEIPLGAIINGIQVDIKMKGSTRNVRDYIIRLRKGTSTVSNNLARTNTAWPTTANYVQYGSSSNLWGLTWVPSDLTNSNFGIEIAAIGKKNGGLAMIDNIKITVYFNLRYYYSKSTGNLTATATWGTNMDGSGTSPLNFTDPGQIFTFRNRTSGTLNAPLTISGQASKLIVGDGVTNTSLTIPAAAAFNGIVDVAANATLNLSNAVVPTLGVLADSSTVSYNALANQSVHEVSYYNLIVAGSGIKTTAMSGSAISVNGNFTINTNIIFNNNYEHVIVSGNFINNGTTTGTAFIWMNGVTATTISGTGTIQNLITDTELGVTLASAQTIVDTLYLSTSTFTTTDKLNMGANSIIIRDDEGALSSSKLGNNLYNVQYVGSSKTAGIELNTSFVNNVYLDLVDTLPNTLSLATSLTVRGNLVLNSGTLDATANNYDITVYKNVLANSSLNNRNNTFTMRGSVPQTISANAILSFYKLTIFNNSGTGVQLLSPVTVSYVLNFSQGILYTSATNRLTLGASAITLGQTSAKYVDGPLSKVISNLTSTTVFPIGGNGLYRPVTLEITHVGLTATTYTVEMVNSAPPAAALSAPLSRVLNNRYYRITKSAGAAVSLAFVTLTYGAEDNISTPANTRIAGKNGVSWIDLGGIASTLPTGTIRSSIDFTSTELAFAENLSVLPVSIVSFKGAINSGTAKLQWITGSELNVDHYEVERSANSTNWSLAATIQSKNSSQLQNTYAATDNNPSAGINYYRLKIIDKNYTYSYSNVISLVNASTMNSPTVEMGISMYPNIISDKRSTLVTNGFTYSANENIIVKIYNSNGYLFVKKTYSAQRQIPLSLIGLPAGIYTMSAHIKGQNYTSSFVIQ